MLYSASHLTFIPTNQEPLSSTGKWHLARNSLPPRHLLTKIISKILLKMRDLTTFAVTTFSPSVGISKMTYQIKADIARITLSIFLSLETNIAWPWYVCLVHSLNNKRAMRNGHLERELRLWSRINKNEMSFKTFGANDYNETFRNASIFSPKNCCPAMLQRLAGWIFMISKCPLCPNVHDVACGYTFHIQSQF